MFDIGFFEIIFILVITLLVVGPERLPRIAKTAGLWIGKMRGFVSSVKADIDKELATEELTRALAKQAGASELEELIDEATGNPLQAGERLPPEKQALKQDAANSVDPVAGPPADDKEN